MAKAKFTALLLLAIIAISTTALASQYQPDALIRPKPKPPAGRAGGGIKPPINSPKWKQLQCLGGCMSRCQQVQAKNRQPCAYFCGKCCSRCLKAAVCSACHFN